MATLCELVEHRITSLLQLELEQRRRKAFVDRHRRRNEKEFGIENPVLVFHTRMGNMSGKLRFWWTGPYWITKEYNGSYQLGTLAGVALLRACVEKRGGTTGVLDRRAGDRRGKERERDPRRYEQGITGTRPVNTEDTNGARDSK